MHYDHTDGRNKKLRYPPFQEVVRFVIAHPEVMRHLQGINHQPPNIASHPAAGRRQARIDASFPEDILRQRRARAYFRKIELLKHHDPLCERTLHIIDCLLCGLPELTRMSAMENLDREPGAYLRLYAKLRDVAESVEHDLFAMGHMRSTWLAHSDRKSRREALRRKIDLNQIEDGDLEEYLDLCWPDASGHNL